MGRLTIIEVQANMKLHSRLAGFVFSSEVIKTLENQGIMNVPIYFNRDKDMNEIDIIIESAGTLYPISEL